MTTRRKVTILLSILLTVVIGVEVFLENRDKPLDTKKTKVGKLPLKAEQTSIEFPPVDRYSEFIERPLFSNTRRPFQSSDKVPLGQGDIIASNSDLELSGITLSETYKLALIRTKRDNAQHRVGEGEELRGWTLEEVQAEKVVMQNGAQTQELLLIRKGDPLAAKRKKLQEESKKRKQLSAKAQPGGEKAPKAPLREPGAGQNPEQDAPPPEPESDEE